MLGDLVNPWNPSAAYQDWIRAARSAVQAELLVARKRVEGGTPSASEMQEAKRLRAAADGLREAARLALRYLEFAVPPPAR